MFVLSRRIGESVIIGNAVTATVAVVGAEFADLHLADVDGAHIGRVTIDVKHLRQIVNGVSGVMIKRLDDRVWLGLEIEKGIEIARSP